MRRLLVAGLVLVLPVALAPAAPVPTHLMPKSAYYYPTKVGAKWVYDEGALTLVVTNVEPVGGGQLVTVERVAGEGVLSPWQKILVSRAGLSMTEEGGEAYTPPWEQLRVPFRPDRVRGFAIVRTGTEIRGKMTDCVEEEVRVPAGIFRAVRVESEWSSVPAPARRTVKWFAAGIGVVKQGTRVLKSFTPGKD